ncbi:MAG: sigma-54 dependent transcriptional regulator [Proteobacteria bacterium]|nr:sigma-54-dependent Fis family transcriptional regulator [Desulfobacula sp.]MBU3951226.1 sigma-54 dependent transcriptional regulator [Pseudomonadota bacterium]MBU4130253.1 sigma-54 dependent transcriptional regulator [Pseudomonadota bacterium]
MIRYTIAIVDDEETIRDSLDIILSDEYTIVSYADAESFVVSLEETLPDVVLMDIGLPRMSGIEALEIFKARAVNSPVIMITAYEDINMVISSMKMGAFDFILKPINPDILEMTIKKAISSIALIKEVQVLQEKFLQANEPCFIGESKNIENIMDFINLVSKSRDTPIMILGETGTGKELIAKAIHARSPVFQGPFVAVNCSAFPEDLIESELFGYEPYAFSGAKRQGKKGLIEEADQGTLFLDEVADLSPAGQAKLLRFLENGEFYKVGGTQIYRVQTRVVSATNKDLDLLVKEEKFRKDLYFRLCVVTAKIPSLNERPEDILPLAKHFLHEFNLKFGKSLKGISTEAQALLEAHAFTGNVRELKNIIERSVLVARNQLVCVAEMGLLSNEGRDPVHPAFQKPAAPETLSLPEEGVHLTDLLSGIEREYMSQAMERSKGNESQAAKLLNMNHHTFRYRWKKLYAE